MVGSPPCLGKHVALIGTGRGCRLVYLLVRFLLPASGHAKHTRPTSMLETRAQLAMAARHARLHVQQAAQVVASQAMVAWLVVCRAVVVDVVVAVPGAAVWAVAAQRCPGLSGFVEQMPIGVSLLSCQIRSALNPMAALLQQQQMAGASNGSSQDHLGASTFQLFQPALPHVLPSGT